MDVSLNRRKTGSFRLEKQGLVYGDIVREYPITIGRLKNYRGIFNDVVVELYRRGDRFYLNFYDNRRGLVGVGRISKLDAYHLIKNRFAKAGYKETKNMKEKDFMKLISSLDMQFIDQ